MFMPKVFARRSTYDYPVLRAAVFELLGITAGGEIRPGSRVLLKPNLLAPARPEKAMLTHPLVVRAAAEYVIEKGARAQVSDSPAMGGFERVIKESGIGEALKGLDVELKEFTDSVTVETGEPFKKIELARDAREADFIINLPKLKTHTQMLLTLGIKNLFGCVVGTRKPEWHFRAGIDRDLFARLLVQVYLAVRPGVTLLDGILAMEGQGPGKGGRPRELKLLMGSSDTAALDYAVCQILGIGPLEVLTNKVCAEMGLLDNEPELDGDFPLLRDFALPRMTPLVFGPRPLHGFLRGHIVQRPSVRENLCRGCGECWKYCPARAISAKDEKGGKKPLFDYDKCIRCYCCLEVCPQGALYAKETVPGKLLKLVVRFKTGKP
jgi:uncharacterized protein (DUF362 family)/Pyruvate/2-oxoacid:ferredoxin oxidoreductase delta subunit